MIRQVLAISLQEIYPPAKAMGGESATIATLVNPIIANILIISGLVSFVVILLSGFNYITSQGDKAKTQQAQNMLNYGIIGLIVVAAAYVITRLIGGIIGFTFF